MKKNNIIVSAIITTYKRPVNIVERAVKSIINQTYKNIEIIVVNDYPDDIELSKKLGVMLDNYRAEMSVKYIVVEKNGGACKARNIGINQAIGEYVAFLDDDDEWLPEKIEEQLKSMSNDKIAISYCNSYFFYEEKNITTKRFNQVQPSGYIFNALLEKNIVGSCSFPLIKKAALEEVKCFDEEMPAMQDWELYIRICEKYEAVYVDKPLVRYYKYEGDRISKNPQKRLNAHKLMELKHIEKFKKNKNALYNLYLEAANDLSIAKKILKALKKWCQAVTIKPTKIKNNLYFFCKIIARTIINKNNL